MEYKALTFINLPFIDRSFAPGQMIDRSEFEEYVKQAEAAHMWPRDMDDTHSGPPDADAVIAEFIEWGSLSEDPDAPIHPDHVQPDPAKPTLAVLVEQARDLVKFHEENNQEVPPELRQLAEIDYRHVTDADSGNGGDSHVR